MSEPTPSKRPSVEQRRATILAASAQIFFEQGYAATSIDSIIAKIGGSKRNIYSEFGSKEGLFTALVTEITDNALADMTVERLADPDLKNTLMEFGRRLIEVYISPTVVGVLRTVMAETSRFPELARAFYEKGPSRASARLAELLERSKARGEINVRDCLLSADNFTGMLRGNLHLQVVLGLREPPDPDEIETILTSVVETFLHGVRGR